MTAYLQLEQLFERLSHLQHLQAITKWDEAVMMPPGGGQARAQALGTLSTMTHETLTDPKVGDLIEQAKNESLTDPWQQSNLRWIEKRYVNATCIPADLVKRITEAAITCEQAWRHMRADNNWKDFAPLLQNNLNLVKEQATIRSEKFNKSRYDVLIDEFSPDISQATIDPIFNRLKSELPSLIQQIIEKQKSEATAQLQGPYATDKQREMGIQLMQAIGFDFNRGRLDVSHHPFCGGVAQDVRITTRYNEEEFITSAMAICHETGHAKYEQGLPEKWAYQPVGLALGMSVHESQSLLIEMQACRTLEFMHFVAPQAQQLFGKHDALSAENLYRLYTRVQPDLIRVDADEVTYPLHVILRYELEKQLIEGNMQVADLPDAWNELMTKYFGLSTKDNYADGVMQDAHWPSAAFGYFPAYTLGALIAAQLFAHAKQSHPQLLENISHGDFTQLFDWLGKHIHSRASSATTDQLLIDATGEMLNPDYYLQHINNRYLS